MLLNKDLNDFGKSNYLMSSFSYVYNTYSKLIKKKIKFYSYIRKFRRDQLPSHICLTASSYMTKYLRISSYIIGSPSSYMTLQLLLMNFLIYEENFIFFFISLSDTRFWLQVFITIQFPSGPLWGILRLFAEIFATLCLSPVSRALGNWFVKKTSSWKSRVRLSLKVLHCLMKKEEFSSGASFGYYWILYIYVVLLHTWPFYNLIYD